MKSAIKLSLFLSLVLSLTLVSAGLFPQPVVSKISLSGYPSPEGLVVQQTNLRTGLSYSVAVDESGFSVLDWGNLPYLNGDRVAVTILACASNPECSAEVALVDGAPSYVELKVSSTSPAGESILKEVKYYYVCTDGSVKESQDACPIVGPTVSPIKEIVTEKYVLVCPDGSVVESHNDCPKDPYNRLLYVVSGLLVVLSGTLGGLYYKNRSKYRWVPGFLAVLKAKVKKAEKLKAEGKKDLAIKELSSVEKATKTAEAKYRN